MRVYELASELVEAMRRTPEYVRLNAMIIKACHEDADRLLYEEYLDLKRRKQATAYIVNDSIFSEKDQLRFEEINDILCMKPDFVTAFKYESEYNDIYLTVTELIDKYASHNDYELRLAAINRGHFA